MSAFALHAARVLTASGFAPEHCVLIDGARILSAMPSRDCPEAIPGRRLDGDLLPGFIDLQVNGGGGVLFNDQPTIEGIVAIAAAHRRFGTTGLLPTLISDSLAVVERAIAAVDMAIALGVPGVLGIHIEGPFLNPAKKGVHDDAKFRRLDEEAIALLASLRHGRTLVTLAPELAPPGAIRALTERGVIVAAGHSAASYEQIEAAFGEGLSGFTHLFNAMSQLGSREPGVVGAALDSKRSWCGLIVDGHHVHPATLRIAFAAKGADHCALVTDAMPLVGTSETGFMLGDQHINEIGGRLVTDDGTLAGSALTMDKAVANAERLIGVDRATALRMASAVPATILGMAAVRGAIGPGLTADLIHVDGRGTVVESWISGVPDKG